ncbi:MAG: preprotein translocase subunit SecE [Chloroflexota bacterium]|nr:preprotein translocase subunit SecE [Chloroflexota bacterium]
MAKPTVSMGQIIPGIRRYTSEIAAELKKVLWPTREETRRLTVMVIIIAGTIGIFLGAADYGFTHLMELILGG